MKAFAPWNRLLAALAAVAVGAGVVVAVVVIRSPAGEPTGSATRIVRCTERMLARVDFARYPTLSRAAAERYVERGYCTPFEHRGWIHDDGKLKLAAYLHSSEHSCAEAAPSGKPRPVPCTKLERQGTGVLDCGLLRLVRRSEAQKYIASLQRRQSVKCDDNTPLIKVGA